LAEQSSAAKHRARQTLINLVLALGATVAIALILVMIVPRDDSNLIKPVDYKSIEAGVETTSGMNVLTPSEMPAGWWSNSARWNAGAADGVQSWHIGFVGPKNQYIGVDQAFNTNPTWIVQKLTDFSAVSAATTTGDWTITEYKGTGDKNAGQSLWVYQLVAGEETTFLTGTATRVEFAQFAKLLDLHFN
jgi:hypothetical protein